MLTLLTAPKRVSSTQQCIVLGTLEFSKHLVCKKKGRWYKWDNPPPGWFKLNIDGSARGDLITKGGVIRDHDGKFVAGFSNCYGQGSNNVEEFLALRDGLKLCKGLQLSRVILESNTTLVVDSIRSGRCCRWNLIYARMHADVHVGG